MEDAGDSADKQAGHTRRFAAFISYSHADADAAAKLQRKLERYRLPKRIAQARAAKSAAIGRIFRDREDFAAASSLSTAIREAISQAEAMVVMCSPDAAASPWVQAEIELFRQLHRGRPILAALLSGEPSVSFPAALTADGNEPLAADLRPEGDGEQLGFLKIVAGIAGVPLDELIQRDAQRRIRRVTVITGAALAAMLIMGVMTTYAISARNEAALQRAAAEGLVEYMLTDLREMLKGVGRSEAMTSVNERALAHYQGQGDLSELPPDSLERRARVILAMGEDDTVAGRPAKAIEKYLEAHRTTEALLRQNPASPDSIFAHAQSEFYVGQSALQRGDRTAAERHWKAYRSLAARLASVEPGTVRSHMELGYSEGNLCELNFRDDHNLSLALNHCEAAIAHEEKALAVAPDDKKIKQDLANRIGWAALVRMKLGNFAEAISYRRREAALMDELVRDDAKNVEYALRRSWAQIGLADGHIALRQYSSAERLLNASVAQHRPVMAAGHGNLNVMQTDLRLWLFLAKAQRLQGEDSSESIGEAARTRKEMDKLGSAFADSAASIWEAYKS